VAFNESYKRAHGPDISPDAKSHQGYFHIKNKEKYVGNTSLIIYRSSWEFSFCKWCDASPSVIRWSSEPTRVPYADRISKLDECRKLGLDPNNPRNWVTKFYNVDFWLEIDKGGTIEKWFIEIKPKHKLKKPVPPPSNATLKEQKRFNILAKEYIINESKWQSMNDWAKKNNSKFYIFTEEIMSKLGILRGHFNYDKTVNKYQK